MGFFSKIKEGLNKTRASISNGVNSIINSFTKIDEELFEELEEALITADVGVNASMEIIGQLRDACKKKTLRDADELREELKSIIAGMMS